MDALLEYLLKSIYDQVSDQEGSQVESKENESDTSKNSRLSYRDSNYVGDIVRAIVDVVYSADNETGKYNKVLLGDIVGDIAKNLDDKIKKAIHKTVQESIMNVLHNCIIPTKRKIILENFLDLYHNGSNRQNSW